MADKPVALGKPRRNWTRDAGPWAGRRYGRWTVLWDQPDAQKNKMILCRCDCGVERLVFIGSLKAARSISCGCFNDELTGVRRQTHGAARTPLYASWNNMKRRCYDPATDQYPNYGGRGIGVCLRWQQSFVAFASDVGPRPSPKHSIDRIDNDGDYEPGNVRWAVAATQMSNRRIAAKVEFEGRIWWLPDLARARGVSPKNLSQRLKRGWSVERALSNG